MNNIKDFSTYICEMKYNKVVIKHNGDVYGDGKHIGHASKNMLNTIDNMNICPYIEDLTGGYKRNGFEQKIINLMIDDENKYKKGNPIEKTRNIKEYPETDPQKDVSFHLFKDKEILDDIKTVFAIKAGNKDIGYGEVLMANYYSNIRRNVVGEEAGDCIYYDNDANEHHIEVKAADAPFKTLDSYAKMYKKIANYINNEDDYASLEDQYAGGIASYMLRQKYSELDLVIFTGEIRKPDTMTGYITIRKRKDDDLNSLINKINSIIEISDVNDTRGGKNSRDFTISCKIENENTGKIYIHPRN